MKPDLFIATTRRRADLMRQVADRWTALGFFPFWIVCDPPRPSSLGPDYAALLRAFDRNRRIMAEDSATTPIYILTDDDVLPLDPLIVERAVSLMADYPKLAYLSAWLDNEPLGKQEEAGPDFDYQLMTVLDAGGLRFIRKGATTEWPPADRPNGAYDHIHCAVLRRNGWLVAYGRELHATHLGKGRSEIWSKEAMTA